MPINPSKNIILLPVLIGVCIPRLSGILRAAASVAIVALPPDRCMGFLEAALRIIFQAN